jgi:hypothetical protein
LALLPRKCSEQTATLARFHSYMYLWVTAVI